MGKVISYHGDSYYKVVYTPLGSIKIDQFTHLPGWHWGRGRCQERVIRIKLTERWALQISGRGKSYRELVGAPKYLESLDWIIDEFDSSFNDLAVASLRYHMDHAVTYCDDERRARYQDLIDRLLEDRPPMFDPGEKHIRDAWHAMGIVESLNSTPPEVVAIFRRFRVRELEWMGRVDAARHDFVDVMRGLWS